MTVPAPLPRVLHLVDDTTAGGVMRVLDHLLHAPALAAIARHQLAEVARGRISCRRMKADVIVSHLAISWRALPMLAALRARHPNTPIIHVEHSYTQAFVAENVRHKRRFATLLRLAYRLFDKVVAVSRAQALWLAASGAVAPSRLALIRSCVDLSAFRAVPAVQRPARVIGAIGRLDRQKGFDTLIAAFRRLPQPDLALQIYGEGPEAAPLRRLAGDDRRIRFMGFAADPVAAMAAVDVVAMPSNWEAYGLVAIEALAAGRGLLVNPVDGLTDHLAQGAIGVTDTSVRAWQTALLTQTQNTQTLGPRATPQAPPARSVVDTPERVFAQDWAHLLHSVSR